MKTICIRDIGRVITGHTPPTSKREYYGDYALFIKPTDISVCSKYTYTTEEGYSELAYQKYKNSLIPKGSTCVVCIGTLGEKMTMAHCDCFTNQSMNSIVPSDDYDEQYVYYLLKNSLHKVKNLNKGTASGREFVSKSTFLDMEVEVFEDKTTQKRIGKALSDIDDLIENKQRQIALIEESVQRIYNEWFVKMHFPGYERVQMVDGVPKGWKYEELQEVADLKAGGDKPKCFSKTKDEKHRIPVFSNGVNDEGLYGYTDVATITRPSVTISARGNVGTAFLKREPYVPIVRLISCIPRNIYAGYLYLVLSNTSFDSNGAAQQQITVPMIKKKKILVPETCILSSFSNVIEPLFEKKEEAKRSISFLIELRDRLLPKLMSGEIELRGQDKH